jgi:membrane protein
MAGVRRRKRERARKLGWFGIRLAWRAWRRTQGRDVMLFTAGVSFFAILAAFPFLSIAVSLYGMFATPEVAHQQARAIEELMPTGAAQLIDSELQRLASASTRVLTLQSAFALLVSLYAAHRGFKALLAGLSFVHDEAEPRGFFGFNWLAFLVTLAAFALMGVVSTAFVALRLITANLPLQPLPIFWNEWLWASAVLTTGFTLLYRYAMSSDRVPWRAAVTGGVAAALLFLLSSWACSVYVDRIAPIGAAYGSVGAVIVLLIWISWNANAVFLGGAVATEVELLLDERRVPEVGRAEAEEAAHQGIEPGLGSSGL